MIKIVSAANRHPTNRSLDDFFRYWREHHGPLYGRTPTLRRYVQHFSVPEARGTAAAPTHDGASMFWFDDLDGMVAASPRLDEAVTSAEPELFDWYVAPRRYGAPNEMTLSDTVRADDRQLFDRGTDWPSANRRATVVTRERIVVDGPTTPDMIKAIYIAAKKPGLASDEFSTHWFEVHGHQLGARIPGLRRYVQNHGVAEAYPLRAMTHDGFSELWFDDVPALLAARESKEWAALSEDGQTLFAYPMAVVVGREGIIKT
jgi:uncharacterized protein (TIGR02118 family)